MKEWRHLLIILALVVLPFCALVAVNAFDYYRFHRAVARAEGLTQSEFHTLADYCQKVPQFVRFGADNVPAAFQPLKPIKGSLYPGSCDALLYELGEVSLWARITTSRSNQQVIYFTNNGGPQITKTLWNSNPEFAQKMSPAGRLLTISQWSMHEGRHWIVLPEHILLVAAPETVGGEDVVLASVPFDAKARAQIMEAIKAIPPATRGKDYRADNVVDGLSLDIRFTPTGETGPDDISISNVWLEAVGPLLDLINQLVPKEYPIEFKKDMIEGAALWPRKTTIRTQQEWKAINEAAPKTPWWCVWRSFSNQRQ